MVDSASVTAQDEQQFGQAEDGAAAPRADSPLR